MLESIILEVVHCVVLICVCVCVCYATLFYIKDRMQTHHIYGLDLDLLTILY